MFHIVHYHYTVVVPNFSVTYKTTDFGMYMPYETVHTPSFLTFYVAALC